MCLGARHDVAELVSISARPLPIRVASTAVFCARCSDGRSSRESCASGNPEVSRANRLGCTCFVPNIQALSGLARLRVSDRA